jgi:hypothetical protein
MKNEDKSFIEEIITNYHCLFRHHFLYTHNLLYCDEEFDREFEGQNSLLCDKILAKSHYLTNFQHLSKPQKHLSRKLHLQCCSVKRIKMSAEK